MPYDLKKSGKGYKVVSKDTGKTHSNKSLSKSQAKKQMRALYSAMKDEGGHSK